MGTAAREEATKAPATARWYATLIVAAVSVIGLMLLLVAAVEVLTATAAPAGSPPWHVSLARAREAIERNEYAVAARLWHEAYLDAVSARRWDALVEVADVYRRLGELGGFEAAARARARELYLTALFRARSEGSLDGVLRVAAAFVEIEDREATEQCLRIAERLAERGPDPLGPARVRMFAERWRERGASGERAAPTAR